MPSISNYFVDVNGDRVRMCVRAHVRTYVRSTSDRHTVHARNVVRILLTLQLTGFINQFCSCLFLVQEMSQTEQESDRQKRLERRRQQDRDKRARETPDERNRREERAILLFHEDVRVVK